eukprot:797854-Pelagomonas_calceolata.AAC.4
MRVRVRDFVHFQTLLDCKIRGQRPMTAHAGHCCTFVFRSRGDGLELARTALAGVARNACKIYLRWAP